jgi:hypothetical protein
MIEDETVDEGFERLVNEGAINLCDTIRYKTQPTIQGKVVGDMEENYTIQVDDDIYHIKKLNAEKVAKEAIEMPDNPDYSGYDKPYTKDLPEETLPIANYEGDNNFVKDIKQKLLRFRKLSEKQIEAALNQIRREGINFEDEMENTPKRTYSDLVKDMKNTFVDILNEKIENS